MRGVVDGRVDRGWSRPAGGVPGKRLYGERVADILVLNAGSSTLKYRLASGAGEPDSGIVERIGEPDGDAADHGAAVARVLEGMRGREIAAVREPGGDRRIPVPGPG